MQRGPVATRRHIDLARIGLGKGDELGNRFGRNRWMYLHDERYANYAGDRRDVADKIEIELGVECRIDRVGRTDDEQRIAVRGRTHGRFDGDIAAGPSPAADVGLLPDSPRQPLPYQTRGDV